MSSTTPESVPRRRLPRPERRASILEAALEIFARDGYHDSSMAAIADAAGISPPILYRHFDSKRDLYLAVLHEQAALLAAAIGDNADPTSAPLEQRLAATAERIVAFVAERPSAWRALRSPPPGDRVIADAHAKLRAAAARQTARTTASDPDFSAPEGIDRAIAATIFGELQWSAYESLGDLALQQPQLEAPQLIRVFMDFIWIGLARFRQDEHW